jgi:hypothetical protein
MTESEWQTRKTRIDTRLNASWTIIPFKEGMNTSTLTNHSNYNYYSKLASEC